MTEKRIKCPPRLTQETGDELLALAIAKALAEGDTLVLDFSGTEYMDSRGGAWLIQVADLARTKQAEIAWEGASGQVAGFIDLIEPGLAHARMPKPPRASLSEQFGDAAIKFAAETRDMLNLVADAVYWTILAPFERRGFRGDLFLDELHEMGVRAVKINALMNFLLGLTIAMMSAAQLRSFGLDLYVADLVMIAFARELAVLMTAVVVSARTGAAIAAELANMQVQEEIDALRGMGLKVPQFLVAPKLLALLVVMPCLTGMGMIAGIAGGAAWGILVLGYRLDIWLNQTLLAASLDDIAQGMLKGFFFAAVIVLVGCHNGLRVKGGSRGVGLMTTRAVVMDIFFIVIIDMLFAGVFYYVLE